MALQLKDVDQLKDFFDTLTFDDGPKQQNQAFEDDNDMIDDDDEKEQNDVFDGKCICGAQLQEVEAQKCYSETDEIECDLCEASVCGSNKVYHCLQKSDKHNEGYDICAQCALPQQMSFGDHILSVLSSYQKDTNLVLSPLSILIAMTLCMRGSAKGTKKELLSVLYPNEPRSAKKKTHRILELCDYYNEEYGAGDTNKPILTIANKIWIKKGVKILDEYRLAIGHENIQSIDVSDLSQAADIVNKWCAKNTNNMIKEVVSATSMEDIELLITNAIYFNGKFVKKFSKTQTKKNQNFYANRNRTKVISNNISMMHQFEKVHFRLGKKSGNGKYDIVKLEYKHSDLSLILAINNYSIRKKQLLKERDLKDIDWEYKKCKLYVPKFKFELEMKLTEVLKSMGIRKAFCDYRADFSGITGNKSLKIDSVIHKAVIEVDEEGTKAAAVTVVRKAKKKGRRKVTQPPTIRMDHPFSFYIFDEKNAIVLFCGVYNGR